MPHNTWPAGTDVVALIGTIQGAVAPSSSECDDIVAELVRDFEDMTGRIPFLSDGSSSVRTFDPPDGRDRAYTLDISAVAVSQVTVNVVPNGVPRNLTLGTEYLLDDVNAPALGKPYSRIIFWYPAGHRPQSVQITAEWGYGTTVPTDAWRGLLRKAAANALRQTMNLSGPLKGLRVGDLDQQFGIRGQKTILEEWDEAYENLIAKYRWIRSH